MNTQEMLSYFNIKRPWDVTWLHRANTAKKLERFCNSSDLVMIEGDIMLSSDRKIVAVHPPQKADVIEFDNWIDKVVRCKKGVKLDFKDMKTSSEYQSAVEPCFRKLYALNLSIPLFLNADVLPGPGSQAAVWQLTNPQQFISHCKKYCPDSILSLGWTTELVENAKYTKEMIDSMLKICKLWENDITFAVRTAFTRNSWNEIQRLLDASPRYTLTLWNNEPVPRDLQEWLKENCDREKTFYDLMDIDNNNMPIRL